jgi:hypothetical protein
MKLKTLKKTAAKKPKARANSQWHCTKHNSTHFLYSGGSAAGNSICSSGSLGITAGGADAFDCETKTIK